MPGSLPSATCRASWPSSSAGASTTSRRSRSIWSRRLTRCVRHWSRSQRSHFSPCSCTPSKPAAEQRRLARPPPHLRRPRRPLMPPLFTSRLSLLCRRPPPPSQRHPTPQAWLPLLRPRPWRGRGTIIARWRAPRAAGRSTTPTRSSSASSPAARASGGGSVRMPSERVCCWCG
jgi:hypothetical protein